MRFHSIKLPHIEQLNLPEGRRYRTPDGRLFPSVTTVLSVMENTGLDEWRAAVGPEEAARIGREASIRGSKVHLACESWLLGTPTVWGMMDINAKKAFECFYPVLHSITEVYVIEGRLYSDKLETAGTVDLICKKDDKLVVLDWKTSKSFKAREDIPGYFMQMAFYAFAFYERTGIVIPTLSVQIATDEMGLVSYEEPTRKWLPEFIKVREQFRVKNGL